MKESIKKRAVHTLVIAVFMVFVSGCAKTPKAKAEKYIDSWSDMGMWLPNKEEIADENCRRNLRPTKYLVNCIIRKLIGR
jgi:hypothetical protein